MGLDVATLPPHRTGRSSLICVGMLSLALVALDISSAGIAFGLLVMVLLRSEIIPIFRLMVGLIMVILLGLILNTYPASFGDAKGITYVQPLIIQSPVMAYLMLWVAIGFSLLALSVSKRLREVLSPQYLRQSIQVMGVFFIALLWLWYQFRSSPADMLAALSGLLSLGVIAVLPMVVWIRRVMPQLRSLPVWILLPVVMYSCFWVILGPIDLNAFPYDQLTTFASSGAP